MPTRLHRPRHDPPSTLDRLLAHPLEATIFGGLWASMGGILTAQWVIPGGNTPASVLHVLPAWQAALVPLFLLVAGAGILAAIFWRGADSTSWGIELGALPLGVFAWACYGIAASSLWWQLVCAAMVAGATGRYVAAVMNRDDPAGVLVIDGKVHLPK